MLTADANWRDIYYEDEETGVHVLPSRLGGRVVHTSEIVGGPAMGILMQDLRRHYDYVIVDLNPDSGTTWQLGAKGQDFKE